MGEGNPKDNLPYAHTANAGDVAHRPTIPLTPRIGEVLGDRYELLELLGRGAFGVVFRARDRVAAESVALKLLAIDPHIPGHLQRLRRELRAARKVSHPNVVRIHDVVELGDQVALSMELIDGETLEARLTRGPLDANEWLALARDLAAGLAAAHAAGVIHRDLKPSNIMVRAGASAMISDFGVSHLSESSEGDDAVETTSLTGDIPSGEVVVGTPLYAAPEQLAGRPVGPEADIYSLGVVLYETATGKLPHRGKTVAALVEARSKPIASLQSKRQDLPVHAAQLVDRMLSPEPERRPSLQELAIGRETQRVARPRSSRGRRTLIASLALAVLVAWVAVFAVWRTRGAGAEDGRPLRLAIEARSNDGSRDLDEAVRRIAERKFANDLRVVIDEPGGPPADATIQLEFAHEGAGAKLITRAVERDKTEDLGTVLAPSITAALDKTIPTVIAALGAKAAPRGPTDAERAHMALLGTSSFDAYRVYIEAVRLAYATGPVDPEPILAMLDDAIRLDPGWVHAHVARAVQRGTLGEAAREAIQLARKNADPKRDPRGWKLLDAVENLNAGHADQAVAIAEKVANPRDVTGQWVLGVAYWSTDELDRQIGWARQLYESHPDLQFGYDLIALLRQAGRSDEVPGIVKAWRAASPDNEQALAQQAAMDAEEGKLEDAERLAGDLLFLHGEQPHRLMLYCDVLILADKLIEARAFADRLVAGGPTARPHGIYRLGVIATLEGRFTSAYVSLKEAFSSNVLLGHNGETTQTLDALRSVATLVDPTALPHWLSAQVGVLTDQSLLGRVATVKFELAIATDGKCPDIAAAVAAAPAGPQRSRAQTDILRIAAARNCAPCADVVRAGLGFREGEPRSIMRFASCAEREGARDLAIRAYDEVIARHQAYGFSSIDAPFDWVLALYERGRLAEASGDFAAAKSYYTRFLQHWGKADRRVPAVDAARQAMTRLGEE